MKVGDKVVVIKDTNDWYKNKNMIVVGMIGTITYIVNNTPYPYKVENLFFSKDELILEKVYNSKLYKALK